MRNRSGRWGLMLCLVGVVATAQELVAPEYRPSLAVLEVAAADLDSIERAQQLEVRLVSMLATMKLFESVTSPAQVRDLVVELDLNCTERACFEAARARLLAQRAVRVTVEKKKGGSRVTLLALDPNSPAITRVEIDHKEEVPAFKRLMLRSPAERDLEFVHDVLPQLGLAFRAMAAPNAKLIVENPDPGLTVLIDGKPAGSGRFELIRPPGSLLVSVGGVAYEPYARPVTLKPTEVVTVDLRLVLTKRNYRGVWSRPAIYLALSGITLLGAGLGFGISALSVQERLSQGGASVPVTRSEAMSAPNNALLAGLLVGTGVALGAGGITWVALTPSTPIKVGVNAPAWALTMGGRF